MRECQHRVMLIGQGRFRRFDLFYIIYFFILALAMSDDMFTANSTSAKADDRNTRLSVAGTIHIFLFSNELNGSRRVFHGRDGVALEMMNVRLLETKRLVGIQCSGYFLFVLIFVALFIAVATERKKRKKEFKRCVRYGNRSRKECEKQREKAVWSVQKAS